MLVIDLLPHLGFLLLNVFIPGPNVLNTIATAMGSGRRAGLACALACGLGLLCWAIGVLIGAAALFAAFPITKSVITALGGLLLQYFGVRYIRKALSHAIIIEAVENRPMSAAFWQAFLVMMTNPKVMTTWLAVISLFPVVARDAPHIATFSVMAGCLSFAGHALFATLFSSRAAGRIYMMLYRPINALVGVCFCLYGLKLLFELLP